jgi:hypothetical protein
MAIQFSRQYGDTVVIATEKEIVLTREVNGLLTCYTIHPETFEFPDVVAEQQRLDRVRMFLSIRPDLTRQVVPDEMIRQALRDNGNAVWPTVTYLEKVLAGPVR